MNCSSKTLSGLEKYGPSGDMSLDEAIVDKIKNKEIKKYDYHLV